MRHSTILLVSIASLCLFSQVLSSSRFLAQEPAADANLAVNGSLPVNGSHPANESHPIDGPKPQEGNHTLEEPHANVSGNPQDHARKQKPHAPPKHHGNDSQEAHHEKPDNSSRLLADDQAHKNDSAKVDAKKHKQHAGNNSQEAHHEKHDNSSRNLAQEGQAKGGKNATHAVRPRAAAPSLNETKQAGHGNQGGNNKRAGKGKAVQGENAEDNFEGVSHETRKLLEEAKKAIAKANNGKNKKANGKQANNGEDHQGGKFNGENGEEAIHKKKNQRK